MMLVGYLSGSNITIMNVSILSSIKMRLFLLNKRHLEHDALIRP
jgi:hypothetical protein